MKRKSLYRVDIFPVNNDPKEQVSFTTDGEFFKIQGLDSPKTNRMFRQLLDNELVLVFDNEKIEFKEEYPQNLFRFQEVMRKYKGMKIEITPVF